MDAHIDVLLSALRRNREEAGESDPCVWWGRVRSANRQQHLPHLDQVLALDAQTPEDETDQRETHLYLTDYRSLYVALVGNITADDMSAEDAAHVPAYYRTQRLACDCWFQLWDIRRLVQDDTLAIVEELKHLRNTHYNDRPVSIYGGMVNLPLIVHRQDEVRYFDEAERERLLDGKYWVEFDAENGGLGLLERDLRENLFGDSAWASLDVGTRAFITTAERIFRDNRANAAFDFAPVLTNLSKAIEVECNRRLRMGLARAPAAARLAHVEHETVDVTKRSLGLGHLIRAIKGEAQMQAFLNNGVHEGRWFTGQLPYALDAFREVRNKGTHEGRIDRESAIQWRDQLLGVGCEGALARLARVRTK